VTSSQHSDETGGQAGRTQAWSRGFLVQLVIVAAAAAAAVFMFDDQHQHPWLLSAGTLCSGLLLALLVRISQQRLLERRSFAQHRRQADQLYNNIVSSIEEGIVVLDRRLICRVWNSAMEEIFKLQRSSMLGVAFERWPLSPADAKQGMEEMLELALSGQVARRNSIRYQLADGSERLTREIYRPLYSDAGEIDGVVGVILNVTQQSQLEAQLRQAQKMEAIGTLAGGVAHDFNNILQAVVASSDLALLEVTPGDPVYELLIEIQQAAQRATNLVRQILTFSHRGEEHPVPVDVTEVVSTTLQLLRSSLPATVTLHDRLPPGIGTVIADPTQLQQILMNLCTNAYQAMADSGGTIEIEAGTIKSADQLPAAAPQLRPGRHVRLTVRDNGPGMTPEVLERIFEPYFSTRQTGGGSGLGLAVVHGIVTGLGGAINVRSQPGQGAAFDIYLPLHGRSEVESAKGRGALPGGDEHLLFVDDEESVARLGEKMLASLGYTVTVTTSSIDALRRFRDDAEGFDLVVTDQTMPGLTGAALAREIKAIRPDTPVILCTGYSDTVDPESGRLLGVEEFLAKPVNRATLAEAVRRALNGTS
jgi:PAS domain S-box-containing protein